MSATSAEEHLRAGRLDEALSSLQDSIRKEPANPKFRVFLFQLLAVNGRWEKALTQLNVLQDMDPECMMLSRIFAPVLQCEALREEVFAGRRSPLIFGEPEEWMGWLLEANTLLAQGKADAASELRAKAFEAAPAVSGKVNDADFEWIADADSRLGPMLELIMDGKYYWVPFSRVKLIHTEPPTDLRDFVWTAAQLVWTNGGGGSGFIPTRYSGTETSADTALRLSKRTDWVDKGAETFTGVGQRVFTTDAAEYPVLEIRKIELNHPPPAS